MAEKLKPCPFCGSNNVDVGFAGSTMRSNSRYRPIAGCKNCHATVRSKGLANTVKEAYDVATKAWNTRSNHDQDAE